MMRVVLFFVFLFLCLSWGCAHLEAVYSYLKEGKPCTLMMTFGIIFCVFGITELIMFLVKHPPIF